MFEPKITEADFRRCMDWLEHEHCFHQRRYQAEIEMTICMLKQWQHLVQTILKMHGQS